MKNIAVFFGGNSVEHDVSVITGVMTCNSLDKKAFKVYPVFIDQTGEWYTGDILFDPDCFHSLDRKKLKKVTFLSGSNILYSVKGRKLKEICALSVAINCLHGERGEDGSLAGFLKLCNIASASPDIFSSALAMDKALTKRAVRGIANVLPYIVAGRIKDLKDKTLPFEFPVIVKPLLGGSSIGIRVADNKDELIKAVEYALRFGRRVIIEPKLSDFTEINCAAYRNVEGIKVSECEQPVSRTDILTFQDKYEDGKRVFPADIKKSVSDRIKEITEKVYNTFAFTGVIRIDYFVVGGKVYLNEINAVPGSLAYYLFGETQKDFSVMLNEIVDLARIRASEEETIRKTYDSGILKSIGAKSAKRL